MKKKKMKITDREIMELLGDPISMDIIGVVEDETVSLDYIVKKLNEKKSLIKSYVEEMVKAGILEKTENGVRTAADSFEGEELISSTNKDNADWIRGFINHMENSLINNLDKLYEKNDLSEEEKIEKFYENIKISYSGIYLTDEEAEELNEIIDDFLSDKDDKERKNNSEYHKYYLYNFFFPEMD